jgi:acyl carrier protein/short-subunit dehydrogenase
MACSVPRPSVKRLLPSLAGVVGILHASQLTSAHTALPISHLRSLNPDVGVIFELSLRAWATLPRQAGPQPQPASAAAVTSSAAAEEASICGVSAFAFQGTNAHVLLFSGDIQLAAPAGSAMALPWAEQRHWVHPPLSRLLAQAAVPPSAGHIYFETLLPQEASALQASSIVAVLYTAVEAVMGDSTERFVLSGLHFTSAALTAAGALCAVRPATGDVQMWRLGSSAKAARVCSATVVRLGAAIEELCGPKHSGPSLSGLLPALRLRLPGVGPQPRASIVASAVEAADEHEALTRQLAVAAGLAGLHGRWLQPRLVHCVPPGDAAQHVAVSEDGAVVAGAGLRAVCGLLPATQVPARTVVPPEQDDEHAYELVWVAEAAVGPEPAATEQVHYAASSPAHNCLAAIVAAAQSASTALATASSLPDAAFGHAGASSLCAAAAAAQASAVARVAAAERSSRQLPGYSHNAAGIRWSARLVRSQAQVTVLQLADQQGGVPGTPQPGAGTALVIGGTGTLGTLVSQWLAEHGFRRLVLLSRSGALPADGTGAAALLAQSCAVHGVQLTVLACDAACAADAAAAVAAASAGDPLAAVFHAGGVLRDATLGKQTLSGMRAVFAAKASAQRAVHAAAAVQPTAAHVLFSSVASLLGSPGQANYAAANAWLDSTSTALASQGLPVSSVQWGAWAGAGMATRHSGTTSRLQLMGLGLLQPHAGIKALAVVVQALTLPAPGAWPALRVVNPFHWPAFLRAYDLNSVPQLFAGFSQQSHSLASSACTPATQRAETHDTASTEASAARQAQITAQIGEAAAAVLGGPVEPSAPLMQAGLDSLGAAELTRALEAAFGLQLPPTAVFDFPTVDALAAHVSERLGAGTTQSAAPSTAAALSPERLPFAPLPASPHVSAAVAVSAIVQRAPSPELGGFLDPVSVTPLEVGPSPWSRGATFTYHLAPACLMSPRLWRLKCCPSLYPCSAGTWIGCRRAWPVTAWHPA